MRNKLVFLIIQVALALLFTGFYQAYVASPSGFDGIFRVLFSMIIFFILELSALVIMIILDFSAKGFPPLMMLGGILMAIACSFIGFIIVLGFAWVSGLEQWGIIVVYFEMTVAVSAGTLFTTYQAKKDAQY